MRTFEKSTKLNNVSYDVRGPVVDEANRMIENGAHILKLNIGNPAPFGFNAPEEIILDMIYNLRDAQGYSDSKGIFSARKAIMQYCQMKNIPNVGIDDIYTGNGVSEMIVMSMQGLLNNGDEILVPSPDYPLWTAAANLAGGHPVHYICDEQADWYPDIEDIKKKITDRTKGIVIINPNNPTGAVYPKEVLEEIVEVARQHELIIFADEIYDRLVMDGIQHISIASLAPDLFTVTMNGLSKSHRVAGFRVGWMCLCGDKSRAKGYIEGIKMLSSMRLCSNVPAQMIVQTALGGYQSADELLLPGGRIYEQREYIYNAINDIPGLSAVKPKAAFYIFPKIDTKMYHIVDDEKFCLDFLREKKVLLLPGKGCNWREPDHFRIVYLPNIPELEDAMGRMKDFLSGYRQV
ncbi:MAG: pyridoxal phosphate-dependent aminotransferase [Lachnospiraceae bacterium]|nr:pyridoxal phosphate-dependent aminotransferase [Candidatus Fimimorpha excrementavium]